MKKFLIDNKDKKCKKCGNGKYVETSMLDDWDGALHCDKCNDGICRWDFGMDKEKVKKL